MAKTPDTNYDNLVLEEAKADAMASIRKLQSEIRVEDKKAEVKPEDKPEPQKPQLPDNFMYIETDDVEMTPDGTYVRGPKNFYQVANFPFFIKHLIRDDKDNVWRIVQVGNDDKVAEALDMEPEKIYLRMGNDDFVSAAKFRRVLYKQQKVFKGKDDALFEILDAMPPVPESVAVNILGWNKEAKAYFFNNVALKNGKIYRPNDFGLINFAEGKSKETATTYFMPYVDSIAGAAVADSMIKVFQFEENKNITFNQWFQMMYDAHLHHCILPVCFMIASLFRDLIFDETHAMPLLYMKGIANSGKSSIIRNLTSVFGKSQKEISLKSNQNTPKSLARIMSQKHNALLWFDEWHEQIDGRVQGFLQSSYDGAGYQRAAMSSDNRTEECDVKSAICLTSNFLPMDDFFFTRIILCQMNDKTKTQEQREAFKRLSELEKGNLSQIAFELLQHRELIEKEFKNTYSALFDYFFDQLPGVRTRFLDNMAAMLAPALILLRHKKIRMVELDFMDKLCDMARKNIKQQHSIITENSMAIEFWNIINILFDRRIVRKGIDFKFLPKKTEAGKELFDEYIAIRLNRVAVLYQKEAGNKAKSTQEIKEMLETAEYFVDKKNIRFTDEEGRQTSPTSAIVLNYQDLKKLVGVIFE